jgi:hypothetical protein
LRLTQLPLALKKSSGIEFPKRKNIRNVEYFLVLMKLFESVIPIRGRRGAHGG